MERQRLDLTREPAARLDCLAVAKIKDEKDKEKDDDKRRRRLGQALLGALHRDLVRRHVREVTMHADRGGNDYLFRLLGSSGYASRPSGSVDLIRINDLARYLGEIASVFERRLRDSKVWASWRGSIALEGERLRACLVVSKGRVAVEHRTPGKTRITLCAGDSAITRIAAGIASPFEEHLQVTLKARPSLNDGARDLLETLFPRILRESCAV